MSTQVVTRYTVNGNVPTQTSGSSTPPAAATWLRFASSPCRDILPCFQMVVLPVGSVNVRLSLVSHTLSSVSHCYLLLSFISCCLLTLTVSDLLPIYRSTAGSVVANRDEFYSHVDYHGCITICTITIYDNILQFFSHLDYHGSILTSFSLIISWSLLFPTLSLTHVPSNRPVPGLTLFERSRMGRLHTDMHYYYIW